MSNFMTGFTTHKTDRAQTYRPKSSGLDDQNQERKLNPMAKRNLSTEENSRNMLNTMLFQTRNPHADM
jgi:hypothetical protein